MAELTGEVAIAPPAASSLHRQLSPFGVWLLALSCLSPVFSVYGVGGDVLAHAGTGTVLLFLIGLGAALLWGFVYGELGSAFSYARGAYGASPLLLTLGMLAAATAVALLGVRTSTTVTGIFLAVEMIAVVTLIAG